jgi:hypothetical protein
MRIRIISLFLVSTIFISLNSATASQLQDNLEGISTKLTSILREKASFLETMGDLELSAEIASDAKDLNELSKIKDLTLELLNKHEVLEKDLPSLKKTLDDDCAKARKDNSQTAEAIDAIGACEDAESVYLASENSTKSFRELQRNIEANLIKFGLTLVKPTPSPSPSISAKPSSPPSPSISAKPETTASKKSTPATKKTIKCVKGKITKTITAVNPKCPTGYKKK